MVLKKNLYHGTLYEMTSTAAMPLGGKIGLQESLVKSEQDFWDGAKVLVPQCPTTYSTSSNALDSKELNDWMEIRNLLDSDQFEPFSDLCLPPTDEFGPDDLFPDLPDFEYLEEKCVSFAEHKKENLNTTDILSCNPITKEAITIKLKKVVCPKAAVSKPFTSSQFVHVSSKDPLKLSVDTSSAFKSTSPFHVFDLSDIALLQPDLTLKEALELDNSDVFLDAYVSPTSASSPISSEESDASDTVGYQGTNVFVSDSPASTCGSYEGDSCSFDVEGYPGSSPLVQRRKRRKGRERFSTEVKYLRKKEQNRHAASRYRQKKREESKQLYETVAMEEERRGKLIKEGAGIKQELGFVKKLMREILVTKKLVSADEFP